jgi:hypothetical protein
LRHIYKFEFNSRNPNLMAKPSDPPHLQRAAKLLTSTGADQCKTRRKAMVNAFEVRHRPRFTGWAMSKTKYFIVRAAGATMMLAAVALTPTQSSAQGRCPAGFSDQYGCTFTYNPARGERGPGNGPYWQGEPNDHRSIWRNNHYLGNDPDPFIREQLMRGR